MRGAVVREEVLAVDPHRRGAGESQRLGLLVVRHTDKTDGLVAVPETVECLASRA